MTRNAHHFMNSTYIDKNVVQYNVQILHLIKYEREIFMNFFIDYYSHPLTSRFLCDFDEAIL